MSRGWMWIGLVVALLAGNAIAVGVLIVVSGDPSGRVLPDYYRKAIAWDDTMAAERASRALGWRPAATLDDGGALTVTVTDAAGAPIAGATVRAEVRHRSRATGGDGGPVALAEAAPGRYGAAVAAPRPGLYQVAVEVARGDDRFTGVVVVERGGP